MKLRIWEDFARNRLAWIMLALAFIAPALARGEGAFDGEWRTTAGLIKITQTDNAVTGVYGKSGEFSLKGTVDGKKLKLEFQQGKISGEAQWTLDESGNSFQGKTKTGKDQEGTWNGWRPDPEAPKGEPAKLDGLWLTDQGLMELKQAGAKAKGQYAVAGVSTIDGKATGRRFDFKHKSWRAGKGWFDVSADGDSFVGAAQTNGFQDWYGWSGRRATEFARHAKLSPGKMVDGSTKGLLTYTVRSPEGYKEGDDKKWPAIVFLHGSNMNGKAYVNTIAAAWPDIGKDYILLGINGETPSSIGENPSFNYTYVDYVGRSTYKGYPGTDRESPALVAEAMDELRDVYPISKYFIGGHSQGGFLTYSLLMNYPEKIAGAFPISCGVIFQCEPTAYAEEKVRAAQRTVPLAIIHGKQDDVVPFSMSEHAAGAFGEASWPAFRFFADSSGAGHRFALLPVNRAIRWLEIQSSDDPAKLIAFAEERVKVKSYRDAIAATNRLRALKPEAVGADIQTRLDHVTKEIDTKATAGAKQFLPRIKKTTVPPKPWVDAFLAYRDEFEFAPAAHEVMEAFYAARAEQDAPAEKLMTEARVAFQKGNRDEGYAKYQEVIGKYDMSTSYRTAKRWFAERNAKKK